MLSLQERLAEREIRRKEGPGPVVIAPVDPKELQQDENDEDFPARVVYKGPGSSKEPKDFVQKIQGDDSINNGIAPTVSSENKAIADQAKNKANTEAALKTSPAAGAGGGAGAKAFTK